MPTWPTKLSSLDKIKLIMLTAMTTGHLAWAFVPTDSLAAQLMHLVGRITIPLACFLVVIGFRLSKDIPAYARRLFGFGVLAQVPFMMAWVGVERLLAEPTWLFGSLNVLFTLGFALLALICQQKALAHSGIKSLGYWLLIGVLMMLSLFSDWGCLPILWVLAIFWWRVWGFLVVTAASFLLASLLPKDSGLLLVNPDGLMDYGLFLAAPLMLWYERHPSLKVSYRLPRLLFYWYYVLHLLVLGLLVQYTPWAVNEQGLICHTSCPPSQPTEEVALP